MNRWIKLGLIVVASGWHVWAAAQMMATAHNGSFTVDGQAYQGGPILWMSLARIAAGGMNPATSAVWLSPEPDTLGNTDGRTMLKFKAGGQGNLDGATWMLPLSRDGSASSASLGEERVFSTWTPGWCLAPMNAHSFQSEVNRGSASGQAWVEIDVQEAPRPYIESYSGAFEHTNFDGGPFDRDPDPGEITIDKYSTPLLSLQFGLPSFEMRRDELQWQDGTTSRSEFYDKAYSSVWVIFESAENQYVFAGEESAPVTYEPGEGLSVKTIPAFAGTMTFDPSAIASGDYTVHYRTLVWTADYTDASWVSACASGFVAYEDLEFNVQVVPEPGSFAAMGIGALLAFGRKRARPKVKCRAPTGRSY